MQLTPSDNESASDDSNSTERAAERRAYGRRSGDPDFMLSLARGLQVTRALARRKRPSTVSQISLETGLSRSVVRRCLYTLTQVGLVQRDSRRHFIFCGHASW
jgi:hypothetical protein